ncbi:MAG: DUF2281 domain-containing protein [Methylococcales bacterium]
MTKVEIENQLIQTLHLLPFEKAEELLDFALFLHTHAKAKPQSTPQPRALGLLQGKGSCVIGEKFSITDEEFLRL